MGAIQNPWTDKEWNCLMAGSCKRVISTIAGRWKNTFSFSLWFQFLFLICIRWNYIRDGHKPQHWDPDLNFGAPQFKGVGLIHQKSKWHLQNLDLCFFFEQPSSLGLFGSRILVYIRLYACEVLLCILDQIQDHWCLWSFTMQFITGPKLEAQYNGTQIWS